MFKTFLIALFLSAATVALAGLAVAEAPITPPVSPTVPTELDERRAKTVNDIIEEMSEKLPNQKNPIARLESVDTDGFRLNYNYTLKGYKVGDRRLPELRAPLYKRIKTAYCDAHILQKNDVTVAWNYNNFANTNLIRIIMTPADCLPKDTSR